MESSPSKRKVEVKKMSVGCFKDYSKGYIERDDGKGKVSPNSKGKCRTAFDKEEREEGCRSPQAL